MLTYEHNNVPRHFELSRQAYLLTGDPQVAETLAERALEAARRSGRTASPEDAKAALIRTFVADPPAPRPPAPARQAADPDIAAWQAVRRLPPRRRAVIVLRYDEGLTEEEAAARLGTSAQAVRADVDAALLTLRTALPRTEDPWTRVAGALGAAGRGWLEYTQPAAPAGRVPEILSALHPAPTASSATVAPAHPRPRLLQRPVIGTAMLVAAVLLLAALVIPRLGDGGDTPAPAAAAAPVGQQAPVGGARLSVPSQPVPQGLLNWPPRGALAKDPALTAAATDAWRTKVPAAEAPSAGITVLWAGRLDGRPTVVLQALDGANSPRVAQVSGRTADSLSLQHAEPLHSGTAVLSLLPASGPAGPNRVLVSPEAQVADGLRASNPMNGMELAYMPLGPDGVSGVLPSPPGKPTCSRVVVLGLDPENGSQALAPQVLYSGVVSADMLGAMPMEVEVGSAELAPGQNAEPETAWFADGERLARKVPGKGTLVVAALGPRVDARPLSATDRRVVSSRAYELRRGSNRYLGSVVEVGGKTICSSVLPAGAVPSGPHAWVLRCPVPGGTTGLLHVVGTPGTETVAVELAPTPSPAGQRAFKGTVTRPEGTYDRVGFAVLETVASGFPCGAGTVQAAGGGTEATPSVLPLYKP